jgi:hypothetical protein
MKILIGIVLLVAGLAVHAGPVAVAKNENGGFIVLTNEPCPGADLAMLAYTTDPADNSVELGCWMHLRGAVQIYWWAIKQMIPYSTDGFKPPSPTDAM